MPPQTTDKQHEVVDIDAIWAQNGSGSMEVVGWTYVTGSGLWVEENIFAKGDFWQQLASSIAPSIYSTLDRGGFAAEDSGLWNTIKNYAASHAGRTASCFSSSLG